jgi:type IV pilus assembly protein PilN
MIRINLLTIERERTKTKAAVDAGQKITVACSLILVFTAVGILWWYSALSKRSQKLTLDIQSAQQEATQLDGIIQQVKTQEQRKAQLQQRVTLIEQLRKGQTGAVHLLDEISRSLPDTLWLTEMKQSGAEVVIDGRCTTLTSLSDFVAALNGTGYFSKGVELVSSIVEAPTGAAATTGMPLIRFQVKAKFSLPGA